eukprot:COSAG02_NODE_3295_length_6994_cov_46.367368_2_plen_981_part_00
MNQYTDIKVIECSRLHSEEAKVENNENNALWQNNLQDIVQLDAGDTVSMFGAMVSERGAGQPSSIEIKGVNLGYTKDFTFTTYEEKNACESIPSKYEIIEANASTQTVSIRDDTLNFNTSYYINTNGHNYIHLPRRWWYKEDPDGISDEQWTNADDLDAGLTYFNPFKDTFWFYDDYYQIVPTPADNTSGIKNFKSKNNNERYTILMRNKSYYTEASASGNLNGSNVRDPENSIYRTFKQLKSITVPSGFNSPEYIATELTRQLQNIKEVKRYEFRDPLRDMVNNSLTPGFPIRMYDTIETETYKPFNVAYAYYGISNPIDPTRPYSGVKDDFEFYINGGTNDTTNASGFKYLSQYHVVATKRPELYETGRLVNRLALSGDTYLGIFGTDISGTSFDGSKESRKLTIRQDYNETNCRRWYEFFKAQELYPEIWNTFSDSRSLYSASDTIDNSRWIHINRFENASQTYYTGNSDKAMLGDSGYKLHSWNASNTYQPASAICPLYYNSIDRDTFYENPNQEQYSFGCMKKSNNGRIDFTFTDNNGWGSAFMDMLLENNQANPGSLRARKLGFDLHFSAPGMCYILPYAGWSSKPNSYTTKSRTIDFGNYDITTGFIGASPDTTGINGLDSQLYRNKLYIGADAPKVLYDGTNFNISSLHTPMNKGNDNIANNAYDKGGGTESVYGGGEADSEAADQVYFINPREQWNDWTPARMPYRDNKVYAADGDQNSFTISRLNDNLEAWTIYDALCGIFISDINITEKEWSGTLWDILGFSYNQFNSSNNTRIKRIDNNNINSLSLITTNADVDQGDSKIYIQNLWGAPLYNNMIGGGGIIGTDLGQYYPEIKQKTTSVAIVADNLPIRMIRGYYTVRSNILEDTPFIGGKVNNTLMPIIGIVNKINAAGDFYTEEESSLQFTITKPLRLASITCSIHDPDGSYAQCSEQSTVLFKIQKQKKVTYNVIEQIIQEQQQAQGRSARTARG